MSAAADTAPKPQRRSEPRVVLSGCGGLLRGCFPITLLDVSEGGLRLESSVAVRPGGTYELTADLDGCHLAAKVLIRRSMACGTVADRGGGRVIVYRAGASFVELDALQRGILARLIAEIQQGAGHVSVGLAESPAEGQGPPPPSPFSRRRRWARHHLVTH